MSFRLKIIFALLLAGACVCWGLSMRRTTSIFTPPRPLAVELVCGGVQVVSPLAAGLPFTRLTLSCGDRFGLALPRGSWGSIFGSGALGVPGLWALWIPVWLLIVLPAIPLSWLLLRRRPIPPGHCRKCSYDLRGNVSGVCPECGTPCPPATSGNPVTGCKNPTG